MIYLWFNDNYFNNYLNMKLTWSIFYFNVEDFNLKLNSLQPKTLNNGLYPKKGYCRPKRLKTTKRYFPGNPMNDIFKGNNPVDLVYGTAFQKFSTLVKADSGTFSKLYLAWQCGGAAFLSMVSIAIWGASIIVNNNEINKYIDAKNTKWTIAKNLLNIATIAIKGTPKSFGALFMSIGSFAYSTYELVKICDTPIIKKPIGLIIMPLTWITNKFKNKAFTFIQNKVEQVLIKTNNFWLIPFLRFCTTGHFRITAKGLGSAEGFNIVKDFDNGLILKANDKFYTVNKDTWNKVLDSTQNLPSDFLSQNLNEILIKAGQEIPQNGSIILNKLLTENLNPEQIKQTLANNNINFFSKEIPTEFIDYKIPYGSWEQVETYINLLKNNLPEQFQEFSTGKFIMFSIFIIGFSIMGYSAIKSIYISSNGLISSITTTCISFWNGIWNTCVSYWTWFYGKTPKLENKYEKEDIANKDIFTTLGYNKDKIINLSEENKHISETLNNLGYDLNKVKGIAIGSTQTNYNFEDYENAINSSNKNYENNSLYPNIVFNSYQNIKNKIIDIKNNINEYFKPSAPELSVSNDSLNPPINNVKIEEYIESNSKDDLEIDASSSITDEILNDSDIELSFSKENEKPINNVIETNEEELRIFKLKQKFQQKLMFEGPSGPQIISAHDALNQFDD